MEHNLDWTLLRRLVKAAFFAAQEGWVWWARSRRCFSSSRLWISLSFSSNKSWWCLVAGLRTSRAAE